jgi:uncharacterized alkaline shock family protein YloU
MPDEPTRGVPGRAVVARRALREIVRDAALGSYGVTGLAEPTLLARCRARLGMGSRAIRMTLHPAVATEIWLTVAYGVPVAEVARQVDSAVRYRLERALARAVGPVTIHVQGLGSRGGVTHPPIPTPQPAAEATRVDRAAGPSAMDDAFAAPEPVRSSPAAGAA